MTRPTVNLGDECQDTITGFKGVATSIHEYIDGCTQICLTPKIDKDGKIQDSNQFDIERIKVRKKLVAKMAARPTGGPIGSGANEPVR